MRTFGFVTLAFQAQGAPDSGTGGVDFVKLIADANWLSKSVLLILLLFSAVSWGIILSKTLQYRRAERDSGTFLQVFRKSTKFSEVQSICASVPASPLVGIFQAGYAELNPQLRHDESPTRRRSQTGRRRAASNLEEPRAGRPGTAARDERRGAQAGEAGAVPGDDGEHHAVHRAVRHGDRDHGRVRADRRARDRRASAWSRPASPKR